MKIYFYCSYDGSPVGFHIGAIDGSVSGNGEENLSPEKINPFIRRCFETGLVRSAFGKIPNSENFESEYFLLKKKMSGKIDNVNYYLNIAIVSEQWEEFTGLMKKGDNEQHLMSVILESIKIDKTSAFGYLVDSKKLLDILSIRYGDICGCDDDHINRIRINDAFFAMLSTTAPDISILRKSLGISESVEQGIAEFNKESGKLFYYGKKTFANKGKTRQPLLAIIAVICAIILIIVVWLKQ